eukprot:CAMPEP_0114661884 /NCGR_PEP_ID=MMETSP0191-20121206/23571_1 /TAXON_ID=126664 /ORGANISM="Sorites sp." /LENGTH=781 /DNA_ID=CAMNT_0001896107 /DNA_START=83 /DNA_END=2428 /DNA_ORIENTATION=-
MLSALGLLALLAPGIAQVGAGQAVYRHMEKVAAAHRPNCGGFRWCNTSLPLELRVDLLVKEITPEEKIDQLGNDLFGGVPAIKRIGLDKYNYIREAAHGVLLRGGQPNATSFPQVIAMAASFNRTLFRKVGKAVGAEARYMQDVGVMWGDYLGRYGGLLLQFNVNLFRDPGRGQETPGESPELSSAFAEEYVQGIQTPLEGTTTPQAGASCKHFAAYSFEGGPTLLNRTESMRHTLPGQSNLSRHNEDAIVTRRDFRESYAKPFKACAKAKALGVMCAYNQVNGVPSCGSRKLLRRVLRKKWGFDGVVVTDCDSISDMYALQDFKATPEATIRAALAAGTDVACSPGFFRKYAKPQMNPLLTNAVKDALRVRFRLGEFDPPPPLPTWPDVSRGHAELALEAALQSAVLLKNDGRLPLQRNLRLALLGPLRNATEELLGNYQAWPVDVVSPLEGLKKVATVLTPGDEMKLCGNAPMPSRPDADAVIIVAGLTGDDPEVQDPDLRPKESKLCKGGCLEGEGCDRPNITLPRDQEELVRTAASWDLPVVLVLISGGALDISSVKDLPQLAGILWMGYPGEAGGSALAQLLVGDVSPSGRLSQTFYRNEYLQHVPMNDYSFPARPGYPGRGYRFVKDEWVLYPFGFGLSYDTFSYAWEQLNHPMDAVEAEEEDEGLRGCRLQLQVTSDGKSDTSVLFFLRPPSGNSGSLQKQLVHFERLHAARSHSVPVTFRPRDFRLFINDGDKAKRQLVTGTWTLEVNQPADLSHEIVVTEQGCSVGSAPILL